MRGLLLGVLLVVTLMFGASHASAILYSLMDPFTAVGIEHDGSQTYMAFGQNLPRPEWVPVYPGASIVQASKVIAARAPSGFYSLELSTRASLDEVKRFYTDELSAKGFAVDDLGIAPLNPATAAYLGIAGTLAGKREATDDMITVQIRTADGLFPSRLLQIHWYRISEYLQHAAALQGER
jgi:hypothetical protein